MFQQHKINSFEQFHQQRNISETNMTKPLRQNNIYNNNNNNNNNNDRLYDSNQMERISRTSLKAFKEFNRLMTLFSIH